MHATCRVGVDASDWKKKGHGRQLREDEVPWVRRCSKTQTQDTVPDKSPVWCRRSDWGLQVTKVIGPRRSDE